MRHIISRRRFWMLLHRWIGAFILVFVVIAGLTGSAIAFWRDIDGWLNPGWYQVNAREQQLTLAQLSARALAAYPENSIHGLLLPQHAESSLIVLLAGEGAGIDEVFIDPYTGHILGARDTDLINFNREQLLPFLYRLHYSLKLGTFGEYLLGIIALLWLLMTLVGMWLAWPKKGKWRKALSVKTSAGAPRLLFDLHRAGGLLFGGVFVVIVWTGLWWNMSYVVQPVVASLLPMTPYPDARPELAGHDIGIDAALAVAQSARPQAAAYYLRPLTEKGQYAVSMKQADEIGLYGRTVVFVSMSGDIAHISEPASQRPGDIYADWQLPLHTGQFLGLPGRLLWCLAGFVPLLLGFTGMVLWLRRSQLRTHNAQK